MFRGSGVEDWSEAGLWKLKGRALGDVSQGVYCGLVRVYVCQYINMVVANVYIYPWLMYPIPGTRRGRCTGAFAVQVGARGDGQETSPWGPSYAGPCHVSYHHFEGK